MSGDGSDNDGMIMMTWLQKDMLKAAAAWLCCCSTTFCWLCRHDDRSVEQRKVLYLLSYMLLST